jgi:uncharacterized RmlC-like cupin family protein
MFGGEKEIEEKVTVFCTLQTKKVVVFGMNFELVSLREKIHKHTHARTHIYIFICEEISTNFGEQSEKHVLLRAVDVTTCPVRLRRLKLTLNCKIQFLSQSNHIAFISQRSANYSRLP